MTQREINELDLKFAHPKTPEQWLVFDLIDHIKGLQSRKIDIHLVEQMKKELEENSIYISQLEEELSRSLSLIEELQIEQEKE